MKKSLLLFSFLTCNILCFAQAPIVSLTKSDFYSSTITCDITADFTYSSYQYCKYNLSNPIPILIAPAILGTFTYESNIPNAELWIDPATGVIDISASDAGDYIITNTIAAANGCPMVAHSMNLQINNFPMPDFTYAQTNYCSNGVNPLPIFELPTIAGIFTSTTGLIINLNTGEIDLSNSTAGTYTVINTIEASGGCPGVFATFAITITKLPIPQFNYAATAYCKTGINPLPQFINGGVAGQFSSNIAGLDIDPTTGEINPANSTAGTYTVINIIAAAGGCPAFAATVNITITEPAFGSFSYNTPLYISTLASQFPTASITAGGVYSSASGLVIDATTGAIDSSASTAGDYIVNYDIPQNAGCPAFNAIFDVTVLLSLNTNHFSDFLVQLFPNPANSKLYIKTPNDIILDKIIITDLLEKIVLTQTISTSEINVEQLAPGIYFVEGFFENLRFQSKFIKK